jgi:hypothetical protein
LAEAGKKKRTISGMERIVGLDIRARNTKSKVGTPFQESDMTIWFGYGLDDEGSMLDWLDRHKAANGVDLAAVYKQVHAARRAGDRAFLKEINLMLRELVAEKWDTIDREAMPPMRKYG